MGPVLISQDEETFTPSTCECEFCQDMHKSLREWDKFVAKTAVQRNMLKVVKKIESGKIRKSKHQLRTRRVAVA